MFSTLATALVVATLPLPSIDGADDDQWMDDMPADEWIQWRGPERLQNAAGLLAHLERHGTEDEFPNSWRRQRSAGAAELRAGIVIVYGYRYTPCDDRQRILSAIEATGAPVLSTGFSDDHRAWSSLVKGDVDSIKRLVAATVGFSSRRGV